MTEKRFKLIKCTIGGFGLWDRTDGYVYGLTPNLENLVNSLVDKNEQLKLENGEMEDYLGRLEEVNEQLKKENQMLNQRLIELDDLKWVREHTVWEQMPTRVKTYTKTSLNGDVDD